MAANHDVSKLLGPVIAIILICAVAIPIIGPLAFTTKTAEEETNTGDDYYTESTAIDMVFTYDSETESLTYSVNDNVYTLADYASPLISSKVHIQHATGGDINVYDYGNNAVYRSAVGEVSFKLIDGSYTITVGSDETTGTMDKAYFVSGSEGGYVIATTFSCNKGADYVFYFGDGYWNTYQSSGIIDDITKGTATVKMDTFTSFVYNETIDVVINWEVVENSDGTYDITNFTTTNPDITFNQWRGIVAVDYNSYHGNTISTMLELVPVLLIVSVIIGTVGLVTYKRN